MQRGKNNFLICSLLSDCKLGKMDFEGASSGCQEYCRYASLLVDLEKLPRKILSECHSCVRELSSRRAFPESGSFELVPVKYGKCKEKKENSCES